MHLRSRLCEINIVVNGVVRDSGVKDQCKTQAKTHSVHGPLVKLKDTGGLFKSPVRTSVRVQ